MVNIVNTDPTMNYPQERRQRCEAELSQMLPGEKKVTAVRFNLMQVRPGLRTKGIYAQDLLLREGAVADRSSKKQFRRVLAVDMQQVDTDVYDKLYHAGIPQLPLLAHGSEIAIMGIPTGAKPLRHEPVHGRESTPTYIGDGEIYHNLGGLYGAAWKQTGKILLAPGQYDSPVNHVAITNFQDEHRLNMYLCPPYGSSRDVDDLNMARDMFRESLEIHMTRQATPFEPDLLKAAIEGFDLRTKDI